MNQYQLTLILRKLRLFNAARSFASFMRSRDRQRLNFFSDLIDKNGLVFDIGANIGQEIDIFLRLGARVIAVEPQTECMAFLRKRYGRRRDVTLVKAALAETPGESHIYLSEANALSSMSTPWMEACAKNERCAQVRWTASERVKTITLDQLIDEHGIPDYCKIDVEGFEYNVISGLTRKIRQLSLEIAPESLTTIQECLRRLKRIGDFSCNHSSDGKKWTYSQWRSETEFSKILSAGQLQYGDIYIRFL